MKTLPIHIISTGDYNTTGALDAIKEKLITYSNINYVERRTNQSVAYDVYAISGFINLRLLIDSNAQISVSSVSDPITPIRSINTEGWGMESEWIVPAVGDPYYKYHVYGTIALFEKNGALYGITQYSYMERLFEILSVHVTSRSKYIVAEKYCIEDNENATTREINLSGDYAENENEVIKSNAVVGGYDVINSLYVMKNYRFTTNRFDLIAVDNVKYRQAYAPYLFIEDGD